MTITELLTRIASVGADAEKITVALDYHAANTADPVTRSALLRLHRIHHDLLTVLRNTPRPPL